MKQWIAALLLMLIPGTGQKPQKVTLMVDDVPVAQVLQALAEQEKLEPGRVARRQRGYGVVTSNRCSWKQALQTVVKKRRADNALQEGNIPQHLIARAE